MSDMQTSTFVGGFLAALVVQGRHSFDLGSDVLTGAPRVARYLDSLLSSQEVPGPHMAFELAALAETLRPNKGVGGKSGLAGYLSASPHTRFEQQAGCYIVCLESQNAHALLGLLSDEWRQIVENSARVFSGQAALPLVKPRAGEGLTKGAALRWEI